MIQSKPYKSAELFSLFILMPIMLALPIPFEIKGIFGLLGFAYVIYLLLKVEKLKFKISEHLNWEVFGK